MTTLILSEIMIEAIIFDFGDVFIDLKKEAIDTEFRKLGLTVLRIRMIEHGYLCDSTTI